MIRFLSICSGIEAASVAWSPLGWRAVGFSEIEPFPCAVLKHHYPEVRNFGDMTKFEEWKIDESVDLVCGGTPCQAFSVAGKRGGMDDARGQLSLKFVEIVARYRPRWVVWENVPGVFSSGGGADFASFLGALTGRDVQAPADGWGNSGVLEGIPDAYGVAWRTLDAQYFGVPQRRRRVFVVGHLGDWRRAAAVLFERESLCGHPPPCRQAGKGTARGLEFGPSGGGFTDLNPTLDARAKDGPIRNQLAGAVLDRVVSCARMVAFGEYEDDGTASAMKSRDYKDATDLIVSAVPAAGKAGGGEFQRLEKTTEHTEDTEWHTTHTLRADGFDASEDTASPRGSAGASGTGRGTPLVPVLNGRDKAQKAQEPIAIQERAVSENPENGPQGAGFRSDGQAYTLEARNKVQAVAFAQNTRDEVRLIGGDGSHVGALAAEPGMKQQSYIAVAMQARQVPQAVAFAQNQVGEVRTGEVLNTLNTNSNASGRNTPMIMSACDVSDTLGVGANQTTGFKTEVASVGMHVRRLTPRECERLQGFPDDYTRIPWRKAAAEDCPDGPRYKALGNSWAVPCARWIGERIQMVEALS